MHHISWDTVGLFPADQCGCGGWWCYSVFDQSQSQGSITLKIIPAVAEEDKLKESRVRLLFLQHPAILRGYHINWKQGLPDETGSYLSLHWIDVIKVSIKWSNTNQKMSKVYFPLPFSFANTVFLLPEGLPSGFVWLHTLWGQGYAMPRGRTSF